METVRFAPWVGSRYTLGLPQHAGLRLMALGVSHHGSEGDRNPDEPSLTADVIDWYKQFLNQQCNAERWMDTFTGFLRALCPLANDLTELAQGLEALLFYNFVQRAMPNATAQPSEADFDQAKTPFEQVVNRYQPTHVFVWGKPLRDALLQRFQHNEPTLLGKANPSSPAITTTFSIAQRQLKALFIHHPSMGFSPQAWAPFFSSFLND